MPPPAGPCSSRTNDRRQPVCLRPTMPPPLRSRSSVVGFLWPCSPPLASFSSSSPTPSSPLFLFLLLHVFVLGSVVVPTAANPDAKRLYDDLLSNYNRLIRPVGNNSDRLTVKMGLKLSQLIDVNLRSQIMTTNVWVEQVWHDYKLVWDPAEYGGVETLHVPSEHIWLPDIVLYNNADGNYEVTIMTKAILHHTGMVMWKPPAIYKSSCEIDVEYFPFDQQTCFMKFGSWTYDGYMVDLKHISENETTDPRVELGIDLREFYLSVEWDIMSVPAVRNEKFYSCCEEPYPDITFNITLRRKTLFYTVNLIIPCVGISYLSVLVFILPSDSGEKMSLCISILLSLTVFFLLLVEIIPPTSITVSLLGKYLLFVMILVAFSVCMTIIVLNVNFHSPSTHHMGPKVKWLFLRVMPRLLRMRRPEDDDEGDTSGDDDDEDDDKEAEALRSCNGVEVQQPPMYFDHEKRPPPSPVFGRLNRPMPPPPPPPPPPNAAEELVGGSYHHHHHHHSHPYGGEHHGDADDPFVHAGGDVSPLAALRERPKTAYSEFDRAIFNVNFIAQHLKNQDAYDQIEQDWKYVAMVLDRMFLWLFLIACTVGLILIIFRAPALYDHTIPVDIQHSKIALAKNLVPL